MVFQSSRRNVSLRDFTPSEQTQLYRAAAMRAKLKQKTKDKLKPYFYDLAKFLLECVNWPEGRKPTEYQLNIAKNIYGDGVVKIIDSRTAEYGPHGIGKTALAALIVHHFSLCSDAMEVDWKCITTAGANTQLRQYLWPEIRKWAQMLKWDVIGREPYNPAELQTMDIKLRHGKAFAVNSKNYAFIEGAHAKRLLYMFDEAKAIPDETFNAAEGAFANVGTFGYEAYAIALSTPGDKKGRFFEICDRKAGYNDWKVIHVTVQDALKAGMTSKKFIEHRKAQWGEESQIFQNRVMGEFAEGDIQGVIPLAWLEAAVERWKEWTNNGKKTYAELNEPITKYGVDIAFEGDDKSAIAFKCGKDRIWKVLTHEKQDPMAMAGRVYNAVQKYGGIPVIDVIGMGEGVYSRLIELKADPARFNAAESTEQRDRLDEFGFLNKRAAAWWKFRESLDPQHDPTVCVPDNPVLLGELTAPRWWVTSGGRYQIESKKEIKKRLGRSTDHADALIMALYDDVEEVQWMKVY